MLIVRCSVDMHLVLVLVLFFQSRITVGLKKGQAKPNIVLFYADDLGYGDLGCYGHPTSTTPNVDKVAEDGLLFTQFYSAGAVCTPSRAALLTGRYQMRVGAYPRMFTPESTGGLPLNETTIADILDTEGYDTYMIGKWHLGYGKGQKYIPTNQGFDHYFGIPYANSQCPCPVCFYPHQPCLLPDMHTTMCEDQYTPCPILTDDVITEQPVDLTTLTNQYTSKADKWIHQSGTAGNPFFLYFAFNHPHDPQFAGQTYTNTSIRGIYGDSLSEMDAAVGQVMAVLEKVGVADNTLTFFISDNGPELSQKSIGGSAGTLKCGKGTTYEGGVRVPSIAHWPGRIKPGRTAELGSTLDLLPTIASVVGAQTPSVKLDGYDMSGILFDGTKSLRKEMFYFNVFPEEQIGPMAVRYNQYKAHYYTQGSVFSAMGIAEELECGTPARSYWDPPLLYNLLLDPEERYNLNGEDWATDVLAEIESVRQAFVDDLTWAESETTKVPDPAVQPCCNPACTVAEADFPACCQCLENNAVTLE